MRDLLNVIGGGVPLNFGEVGLRTFLSRRRNGICKFAVIG
jgi:hypothetical protein